MYNCTCMYNLHNIYCICIIFSTAFFRCYVCHATATSEIDRGRISEPSVCQNCNTSHSYALVHNRSQFTDLQIVKLQESPGTVFHSGCLHNTWIYGCFIDCSVLLQLALLAHWCTFLQLITWNLGPCCKERLCSFIYSLQAHFCS